MRLCTCHQSCHEPSCGIARHETAAAACGLNKSYDDNEPPEGVGKRQSRLNTQQQHTCDIVCEMLHFEHQAAKAGIEHQIVVEMAI